MTAATNNPQWPPENASSTAPLSTSSKKPRASSAAMHYYAVQGIGRLKATDRIANTMPYGEPNLQMNTVFFNVMNSDNGRTWSTEWIIDDVEVFVARR